MTDLKNKSKNLKILYSHRTRGTDVEGVHIKGLSDAFIRFGHAVDFIAVPGANTPKKEKKGKNLKSKLWDCISKYSPQLVFEFMELVYNFLLYIRLIRKVRRNCYDFIYERYALNTFATVLFAKRHNMPIILEVNDATGIPRVRRHKAESIAKYIERWVFRNSSAIITISSEFQRILKQRIPQHEKVTFVPNAVDPNVFNPDLYPNDIRTKIGREKIIIGFVGSFAYWHKVDLLIDIIPDIVTTVSNSHFLLVGDGTQLKDCKKKIEEQRLALHVTFVGKISPNKVPVYLKAMDIGVIPDSNTYGSPMKLFEYMAMEVVPVAPMLPPILDVIRDGETGILFDQGNKTYLKEALLSLCKNGKKRKMLAQNARRQVLKKHLWCHNASHVLDIYDQICDLTFRLNCHLSSESRTR